MRRLYVVGVDVLSAQDFQAQICARCLEALRDEERVRSQQGSIQCEPISPSRISERFCRRVNRVCETRHTGRLNPRRGFLPQNHFSPGGRH